MLRTLLPFLLLTLVAFTSCGDNEDTVTPSADNQYVRLYHAKDIMETDFTISGPVAGVRKDGVFDGGTVGEQEQIRYDFPNGMPDGTYTLTASLLAGNPTGYIIEIRTDDGIGGNTGSYNFDRSTTTMNFRVVKTGSTVTIELQ